MDVQSQNKSTMVTVKSVLLEVQKVILKQNELVVLYALSEALVFDNNGISLPVSFNSKDVEGTFRIFLDFDVDASISVNAIGVVDTSSSLKSLGLALKDACEISQIFKYGYAIQDFMTDSFTSSVEGDETIVTLLAPELLNGTFLGNNLSFKDNLEKLLEVLKTLSIIN